MNIIRADARDAADHLERRSVRLVVTSPPYPEQRYYGDDPNEIGHEGTVDGFVENLVDVFGRLRSNDVFADRGALALNLGDKANGSGGAGGDWTRGGDGVRAHRGLGAKLFRDPAYLDGTFLDAPGAVLRGLLLDGWRLRAEIVWRKVHPDGRPLLERGSYPHLKRPKTSFEKIFILAPGPGPILWLPSMAAEEGSIWTFPVPRVDRSIAHLAPFPEELPRRCILPMTYPGDLVVDLFAGSGTTLRVAEEHGRRAVGFDLYAGLEKTNGQATANPQPSTSTPDRPSRSGRRRAPDPQPRPEVNTTILDPEPEVEAPEVLEEPLYRVDGFYLGDRGYDEAPDGPGNHVTYANLTRRDLIRKHSSAAEADEWIATGSERRKTAQACQSWWYTVERQARRLTYDPVSRTYLEDVPPHRWDPESREYVRIEEP